MRHNAIRTICLLAAVLTFVIPSGASYEMERWEFPEYPLAETPQGQEPLIDEPLLLSSPTLTTPKTFLRTTDGHSVTFDPLTGVQTDHGVAVGDKHACPAGWSCKTSIVDGQTCAWTQEGNWWDPVVPGVYSEADFKYGVCMAIAYRVEGTPEAPSVKTFYRPTLRAMSSGLLPPGDDYSVSGTWSTGFTLQWMFDSTDVGNPITLSAASATDTCTAQRISNDVFADCVWSPSVPDDESRPSNANGYRLVAQLVSSDNPRNPHQLVVRCQSCL